jgi:hypothetical protein
MKVDALGVREEGYLPQLAIWLVVLVVLLVLVLVLLMLVLVLPVLPRESLVLSVVVAVVLWVVECFLCSDM